MRDPRYDILFEPVRIGPVTAKNRFYQVPQCNGMGYRDPTAHATMRGIKAEGGWGVVCTEQAEIHHTSEITPFIEQRIWDDQDIPALRRTVDAIHAHGALAGIELAYNGMNGSNLYTREVPMGPGHLPVATFTNDPYQARAMDKRDIANLRRWHKAAALRAKRAGFDIVYVYAAHGLGTLHHFLSRRFNQRSDEYGGSLENRMRFPLEVFDAVRAAFPSGKPVTVRLSGTDWVEGGWDIAQTIVFCKALEARGASAIHVSSGGLDPRQQIPVGPNYQVPLARAVKGAVSIPVIAVGLITEPEQAEAIIATGDADMIALARTVLYDPRWPWHAAAALGARVKVAPQFLRSQPHTFKDLFVSN